MNRTLLFISLFSIFILVSCQSSPKNEAGKQNEVELVAEKQLAFPLDEQTYYLSKSISNSKKTGKNTFTLRIHKNHYMTLSFLI